MSESFGNMKERIYRIIYRLPYLASGFPSPCLSPQSVPLSSHLLKRSFLEKRIERNKDKGIVVSIGPYSLRLKREVMSVLPGV